MHVHDIVHSDDLIKYCAGALGTVSGSNEDRKINTALSNDTISHGFMG